MRVGWLADQAAYVGGAELTQAEFRAAAPGDVEIVDCPPGHVDRRCDRYAIHNCITYELADLMAIKGRPAFRYWNDVGSWYQPQVRAFLDEHATPICCSPLQQDYMGFVEARLIPPPVPLDRFEQAAARSNGHRAGTVSVGSWRNLGKAPHRAQAWAAENGGVNFYGPGAFAPEGSKEIAYQNMPALLATYQRFVFLPMVIEPFGRTVVEAWAAGCELVINGLVGARYWIEQKPDRLRSAAGDYWELVTG